MRITDWELPDPGELIPLSSGWEGDGTFSRYLDTRNDGPLLRCFQILVENGAKTAVVETRYLGKEYRHEYTHFYSRTFANVPDSAHRIHFFSEVIEFSQLTALQTDCGYLGYVVIRPSTVGSVAKAMLAPPQSLAAAVRTAVSERVHLFGQALVISGVPFTQQDARLGACAHAAAWMCHYTLALLGQAAPVTAAEFASAADASLAPFRAVPTSGLTVQQLSDLFRRFGTPAMFYFVGQLPSPGLPNQSPPPTPIPGSEPGTWDYRVIATACRHLNGGFPVLVGTTDHAFVLCGWKREGSLIRFVRHDDQQGPYLEVTDPLNDSAVHPVTGGVHNYGPWVTLHVPLPSKAWLMPESAEIDAGYYLLAASSPYAAAAAANSSATPEDLQTLLTAGRLSFHTYIVSSNDYKSRLESRGFDKAAATTLRLARMPRFLVVVEAIDRTARTASLPCVAAEMVYDATSSDHQPEWIASLIHGIITVRSTDQNVIGPLLTSTSAVATGAIGPP